MDVRSYLHADAAEAPIDPSLYDDWRWLVPERFRPLRINLFGDALFQDPVQGHLLELDVLAGEVYPLALDHEAAREVLADPRAFAVFARLDLADQARGSGLQPGPDELYCLIRPLHLGGDLTPDNLEVAYAPAVVAMAAEARKAAMPPPAGPARREGQGFWAQLWRRCTGGR